VHVRIVRRPTETSVDGFPLWHLEVGRVYAVPASLATLLIVEGWAEPVAESAEPTLPPITFNIIRPREPRRRFLSVSRLRSELGIAADRRRKK
jgi:hypothetical protein